VPVSESRQNNLALEIEDLVWRLGRGRANVSQFINPDFINPAFIWRGFTNNGRRSAKKPEISKAL